MMPPAGYAMNAFWHDLKLDYLRSGDCGQRVLLCPLMELIRSMDPVLREGLVFPGIWRLSDSGKPTVNVQYLPSDEI